MSDTDVELTIPDFPRPAAEERRLIEIWKSVSSIVHALRFSDVPTSSNGMLRELIGEPDFDWFAPLFQLWIGDNHQFAGELPEAIAEYREVADRYPERTFIGQAYGAIALEQAASCHERLGQPDEATSTLRQLLERFSEAYFPGWISFRLGQISERAGRLHEAIEAYQTAAEALDPPNGPTRNYRDRARRCAERLKSSREWIRPSSEEVVSELVSALGEKYIPALKRLASPTHFTVGMMMSECCFVESRQVLELLEADISGGVSFPEGFHRSNRPKIYLPTDGWTGDFFAGPVMFMITEAPGGYEWSGVVLTREPTPEGPAWDAWNVMQPIDDPEAPGNLPGDHRDPPEPPGGPLGSGPQPLAPLTVSDLKLKCPWQRGEEFYAGGLIKLGLKLAVLDAALVGSTVAAVPVVGPVLAGLLWTAAATAAPIVGLVTLPDLLTDYPCGLGAGGLYYNQQTTHVGRSAWAVDFATFNRGLLPIGSLSAAVYIANNRTFGQPALAVADGVVTGIVSAAPTGSTAFGNSVTMDITSSKEEKAAVAAAFFIALFTGSLPSVQTKYSTLHLHLDGPGLIPVSVGMYLRQGARLGLMDDTGVSQAHHLHFELIDNTSGLSVRPTPMDGQTLELIDDGRCMVSTNVPIP